MFQLLGRDEESGTGGEDDSHRTAEGHKVDGFRCFSDCSKCIQVNSCPSLEILILFTGWKSLALAYVIP